MSPWTLLGWLILGLTMALVGGLLHLAGWWLNWPNWMPWALWVVCLIPPFFALLFKVIAKIPGGKQQRTLQIKPNPLTENWQRLTVDLSSCRRPCFLLLGEDDAAKHNLMQSAQNISENINSRLIAGELSLALIGGAVWIDVPAAWVNWAAKTDIDSAASSEVWLNFVDLLDDLPGWLAGAVVLTDLVRGPQPEPGGKNYLLQPLAILNKKIKSQTPLWWLGYNLEALPGGGKLLDEIIDQKRLNPDGQFGAAPFGGVCDPTLGQPIHISFEKIISKQMDDLSKLMHENDCAALPNMSQEALLLSKAIEKQKPHWLALGESLNIRPINQHLKFNGLFWGTLNKDDHLGQLALGNVLWETIPDRTLSINNPKTKKIYHSALTVIIVLALIGSAVLGFGGWQCHQILNHSLEADSLLRQADQSQEGPPILLLSQAARHIDRMQKSYWGPARIFTGPGEEIQRIKICFAGTLERFLPKTSDSGLTDARVTIEQWLQTWRLLANSEHKRLVFKNSGGRVLTEVEGFTVLEARTNVANTIDLWNKVAPQESGLLNKLAGLQEAYDRLVYESWRQAGEKFLENINGKTGIVKDQSLTTTSDLIDYPGFNFLDAAAAELSFAANDGSAPAWVAALMTWRQIRAWSGLNNDQISAKEKVIDAGTILQNFDRKKIEFGWRFWLEARDWLRLYEEEMKRLAQENTQPQALVELARNAYLGAATPGRANIVDLINNWEKTRYGLVSAEPALAAEQSKFIMDILAAPVEIVKKDAWNQAAIYLQKQWDQDILMAIEGLPDDELDSMLFTDYALVETFVKETAQGFIGTKDQKYIPAVALAEAIPFSQDFLRFINDGPYLPVSRLAQYPVTVDLLPVTANRGASQPRGMTIKCLCGDNIFEAETYNYKKSLNFTWQPEACGETMVTVFFDTFEVTKTFPMPLSFANFAAEAYPDGLHWVVSEQFPGQQPQLESAGVEWIKLKFDFYGIEPVLELLNNPTVAIPKKIIAAH